MRSPVAALLLACAALLCGATGLHAQEPEDAFLTLRYDRYVDVLITALYRQDSLYLPLAEILRQVRIEHRLDPAEQRLSGQFREEPFELDLRAGALRRGATRLPLEPHAFITRDVDVFVLPRVLEQLFGITVRTDLRALTVELVADGLLPIAEQVQREERNRRNAGRADAPPAPLVYGRDPVLFGPGVLQYAASFNRGPGTTLDAALTGGAEVLYGDLSIGTRALVAGGALHLSETQARWRYLFADARLGQVSLGDETLRGLQPYELRGLAFSNRPVQPRTLLGRGVLSGRTGAGWQVEAYSGERLIGSASADPDGHYAIPVSLTYGADIFTLFAYGPDGQVDRWQRRLEVPFTLLPPGTFEYQAGAGRLLHSSGSAQLASFSYGVSEALTLRAGVDRSTAGGRADLMPHAAGIFRLGTRLLGTLEAAPGTRYRSELNVPIGPMGSIATELLIFDGVSPLNPQRLDGAFRAQAFLPTERPLPLSFRLEYLDTWRPGLRTRVAAGDVFLSWRAVKPWLGVRRESLSGAAATRHTTELRPGFYASLVRVPATLSFLRLSLLRAAARYGLESGRIEGADLTLSRAVTRQGWLTAGLARQRGTGTRLELRFTYHGAHARASTVATLHQGDAAFSQQLRGSAAYDPADRSIAFSGRDWVGRAGTSMVLFLDADGDGVRDPGEERITDGSIRFRSPIAVERTGSHFRTDDLAAYFHYTVDVEPAAANPLWLPRHPAFAFVADPNRIKHIDVPFFAGGIVEGTVSLQDSTGNRPLAGMRVTLAQQGGTYRTSTLTFNDGSFYVLGVPPGDYAITVDPAQAELLGATSASALAGVTVRATAQGDFPPPVHIRLQRGP